MYDLSPVLSGICSLLYCRFQSDKFGEKIVNYSHLYLKIHIIKAEQSNDFDYMYSLKSIEYMVFSVTKMQPQVEHSYFRPSYTTVSHSIVRQVMVSTALSPSPSPQPLTYQVVNHILFDIAWAVVSPPWQQNKYPGQDFQGEKKKKYIYIFIGEKIF